MDRSDRWRATGIGGRFTGSRSHLFPAAHSRRDTKPMTRSEEMTRREVVRLLGAGVAAALALPDLALAAAPMAQKGAVIRTVLRDYAAEELAGGATLFHEHMSTADDFMTR